MAGRLSKSERRAERSLARAGHLRGAAESRGDGDEERGRASHRLRVRPRGSPLRSRRRGPRRRVAGRGQLPPRPGRQRPSVLHRHARRSRGAGPAVKLAVIGGGITGLAAAHRAVELGRERGTPCDDLALFEAGDRVGGTIQTERHEGFLVERGPDSFLSEKPWALALCRRLGFEDRLIRTDDRFRRTFVVFGGRLHPLPEGFQLLAPTRLGPFVRSGLFSWPGKLRMAMDLVLPRGGDPDESLGAFVSRRLGREALERVAQPLVAGIYTADPDTLSLAAT